MNKNQFKRLSIIHTNLLSMRRFTGEELLQKVQEKLENDEQNVSLRTLKSDIDMLRTVFDAPIPEGKYLYTKAYSFLSVLNISDLALLEELKGIINKVSQLNLVDEILKEDFLKLSIKLKDRNQSDKIVYFETNEQYWGLKHLLGLFEFIIKKQPLLIKYERFFGSREDLVFHPYILKEYNNRWYLYGLDHADKKIKQLGLERIKAFEPKSHIGFIENKTFDPKEYFSAMVGVTGFPEDVVQKIKIRVYSNSIDYVKTKPIHHSQTPPVEGFDDGEKYADFDYNLIDNYEFRSKILALGANAEVREPKMLRWKLAWTTFLMALRYLKVLQ